MLEDLDIPPRGNDSFIWTDFIELRALIHPDRCFSRGDLSSIQKRGRDNGHEFSLEDKWRSVADFSGIRRNDFGESYPFLLSDDKDTISSVFDDSPKQRFYVALLVASCMRNIAKKQQNVFARFFEKSSFEVFSRLMPDGSEVRATWANGGEEAPYTGTLFQKMQQIASDIRCAPNFKARDFKTKDRGDGGIDLIAWHPMTDGREGMPVSFAQCGCSRDDWRFKQLEASPAKHDRHLPLMHTWTTYYFLPLDLRESDGDWAYKSDIGKAIIVDRLRLIRLAEQYQLCDQLPEMTFMAELQACSIA